VQHTGGLSGESRISAPTTEHSQISRSVGNVAERAHFPSPARRWNPMQQRGRRIPRLAGAATVLVASLLLLSACFGSAGQQEAFVAMNNDRAAASVGPVIPHGELIAKAQAWADKLSRDGRLSHSTLSAGVPGCWRSLGENVGYGSSVGGVEDAFMNSSAHKNNILNGAFQYAGTGVAWNGSRVYVVQVFMQGC
jgi:uncharacterized protein YkwD